MYNFITFFEIIPLLHRKMNHFFLYHSINQYSTQKLKKYIYNRRRRRGLRNCLIQYEVDKVEKQFGLAKPEKVVIGLHKQRPSNNMRAF